MSTPSIYLISALSLLTACASSISGGGNEQTDAGATRADAGNNLPDGGSSIDVELSLTPSSLSIALGQTGDFSALVTENMIPVNRPLLWESEDSSIASVSNSGQVTGNAVGSTMIQLTLADTSLTQMASVTVTSASCIDGNGNNGDSCAGIYQGVDIWRCTVSSNQDGNTVSQVCRDSGQGAEWITFNVNPIDCCTCMGSSSSPGCCAPNSNSSGC